VSDKESGEVVLDLLETGNRFIHTTTSVNQDISVNNDQVGHAI
jgi:hypothetical protein